MLTWLWRLLVVGRPPSPRISALASRLLDVETEQARMGDRLRELNARVTTATRQKKLAEDAPQPTLEEPGGVEPSRAASSRGSTTSAHLARRFKMGG